MAVLLLGGAPAIRMERRLLLYSCDARRRHDRRRNKWDNNRQPREQHEEQGRVSITVEDVGKGVKEAVRSMARTGNQWRANALAITSSSTAVSKADRMASGALCLLLIVVVTKAAIALRTRYLRPRRNAVTRRDRSLGGREVIVATRQQPNKKPLVPLQQQQQQQRLMQRRRNQEQVPAWWSSPTSSSSAPDLFAQAEADALVRAIVNKRLVGVDFDEEDAVQLRQICRHSSARVEFGTENTRDSFFRAAVGHVLSACTRLSSAGCEVEYRGEDMVSFVCGLATNINLEPVRAASIVNAAVAARTRAGFLQAWASIAQGNVNDATSGIRQLVCMHLVFPPEPNSPHMEMVARGLETHLSLHERLELLQMYAKLAPQGAQVALGALSLTR